MKILLKILGVIFTTIGTVLFLVSTSAAVSVINEGGHLVVRRVVVGECGTLALLVLGIVLLFRSKKKKME
ncbi:MAG: hypothetical protein PUB52_02430 [Lachnospiraceae bacterium]|nr:hypothetical protein [Lachnospiraceae bacterium]